MAYDAFFRNPSGKSESLNEEDDLLQNQNKSAVVEIDPHDCEIQIDEEAIGIRSVAEADNYER